MNAASGQTQNHHLLHPHLLCIAQVTQRMTATKAEHLLVVHLHLQTTGAVNLLEMNRHQIEEDGKEVVPDLLQSDLIGGLVQVTETKIEIEIGIDQGSTREETGQDLDQEEDLVLGIEGVAAVEIEVETDIDTEKVVDIIEHRHMSQMHWKTIQMQLLHKHSLLHSQMPLKMMVVLWKCLKRCKNKCNQRNNLQLLFWKKNQ